MRGRMIAGVAMVAILGLASGCSSTTSSGTGSSSPNGSTPTTSSAPGSGATAGSTAADALTTALEKEHDAKATYDNVISRLGAVAPFTNVSSAESEHIATLDALAASHSVSTPSGPFTGQAAPATTTAACQLGVSTEQGVISTYDQLLPKVQSYPDLTTAFTNLRAAAQDNHLPAFEHCA